MSTQRNNSKEQPPFSSQRRVGPFGGGHRAGFKGPKVKAKDSRKTLKKLWQYLKRQKKGLIMALALVIAGTVLSLLGPYLIGLGVDTMIGPGRVDLERLGTIALWMLTAHVLSALMGAMQTYVIAGVSHHTVRELRKDLFEKVQMLPVRFFDQSSHGELMSRLTNDIETVSNTLTQSITHVLSSIITVVGALGMMLLLSPILTVISLISVPFGLALTGKIAKGTRKHFLAQQQELGALNGVIEETISGQRVVKAFNHEEKVIGLFEGVNLKLKSAGIKAQIYSGVIPPLMGVVSNISFALVAGAGGWMALKGMISIGIIASFLNYSRHFARPINDIANQFNLIQSAIAGAERVFEVMEEEVEFSQEEGEVPLKDVSGKVVFQDVTFGYQKDLPVLKNISLTAEPGQTIALVGPTGAGKTTIVNLLTRFYDVEKGSITIDGKDIRRIKKESLRKKLGIVLQDAYLFSDTVRENIRFGKLDAADSEVEAAARMANAEQFILRLPQGYDTFLSDEGGNLSQGQRQLLTIARAILANPSILILDEATSSVDTRTEMHIQEAMLSLMKGRTSFVIAHRLSTIRGADLILVINDGEIVEKGTHSELLEAQGFYHQLYHSQFKRGA
ncbi:MAG: ABC transporter ATP-binding protein [Desulfitobacteriaceae bacterium]|nr:ABC transporter ATP-binding protein [Desulfitobacteriaceae bacterium]